MNKQKLGRYALLLVVLSISYFSPMLALVIFFVAKLRKLDKSIGRVALVGCIGAMIQYSVDFVITSI